MNVLTIGTSPHLHCSLGRLHKSIINDLQASYHVEIIGTSYDITYFLPNQLGNFEFQGCRVYPYLGDSGGMSVFCIDQMKRIQPDVVITIGNRQDFGYMAVIKSMYPHLFKWIAIISTTGPFDKDIYDWNLADAIIVTNKNSYSNLCINSNIKSPVFYLPYHSNADIFRITSDKRQMNSLYVCKNRIESNPATFIRSLVRSHIPGYLYYNVDDSGDYDINRVIHNEGAHELISVPTSVVSMNEGLSDNELCNLYNLHFTVVDCSMQPKTGMGVFDGMLCGCLPIGPNFGAIGDMIGMLPDDYRFFVPFERILLAHQEDGIIISEEGLIRVLMEIKHKYLNNIEWRHTVPEKIREIAIKFTKEKLVTPIISIIEDVVNRENVILVDLY